MTGFVYLWMDTRDKRFYIGSHYGSIDDNYISSSKWMLAAYKKRPESFKRRILQHVCGSKTQILEAEQRWLDLIKENELGNRYFNLKKLARGGSNKGHTKNRTKPAWNKGFTQEMIDLRRKGLLCFLRDQPKKKEVRSRSPAKSLPQRFSICERCEESFQYSSTYVKRFCSTKCAYSRNVRGRKINRTNQAWNKGLPNPNSAINGRKGADKMKKIATGRRRLYAPDGSWSWEKGPFC